LPVDAATLIRPVLAFDPPETSLALLRLLSALALFVVVTSVARRRNGRRLAFRILAGGAAVLAVVAVAHTLGRVPGIYGEFGGTSVPIYAPMRNVNQLARVFGGFGFLLL